MRSRLNSLFLIVVFIIVLSPIAITRANATIVVNTSADEDNTGPNCSLREAMTAANTNANYGGCTASGAYGTDTITFDPHIFSTAQTINLFDRLPDITSGMSIKGPGANLLTISGENQHRPFYINVAAAVTLSDMTITQGMADFGGGVDVNYGFVMLQNVVVSNSFATQLGGGVILLNGGDPSEGTLWIMNSTLFGNIAQADGGAIYTAGTLIVSNTTISGNNAGNSGSGNGGAIQSEASGIVTLVNVTVSGNGANGTGGSYNGDGTLTLRNSILANSISGGDCTSSVSVDMQNSLIEDGGCGITNGQNGNLTGDPLIGGLGFYGGSMMTMMPAYNSPVINAGDNSYLSEATLNLDLNGDGDKTDTLSTDQRGTGYPRVNYAAVDMGADELSLNVPASLVIDTTSDTDLHDCTSAPNDCSLRGAIALANVVSTPIIFDSTVFATPQTITLTSALPNLTATTTIDGGMDGNVTISDNHLPNPVFTINSGATVTLKNLTVSDGGDVGILNNGILTVQNTTISNNAGILLSGGINNTANAMLWVLNSTISGNSGPAGGGLRNSSTAIIVNSTITGNTATNHAGGIDNTATLTLVNSTVSENISTFVDGGITNIGPTVNLYNTIVANNTVTGPFAGDPQYVMECDNVGLASSVQTYNTLVKDGTCLNGTGNLTGDPLLQPLANNGGPTQTDIPLPASPVINAGNNTYLSEATLNLDLNGDGDKKDTLTADQRGTGYARVANTIVDMGAVENSAQFTGLIVDTTSDADLRLCTSAANDCSLRGVINLVDILSGAHTITFDSTVFGTPQTITLTSALPGLTGTVTIDGGTDGHVTVSGGSLPNRVFSINSGATVTLENLTVSDGTDGGIYNAGTLTVLNMTISNNTASNEGGGIYNIANATLRVLNTTISGNSAQSEGGGLHNSGTGIIVNSTITGNVANSVNGGIGNDGILNVVNSTVSNNTSNVVDGGIGSLGGNGTFKLYNTIVAYNHVTGPFSGMQPFDIECDNGNQGSSVQTYNTLVKDGSCLNGTGSLSGDPLLNGLANNGGLTQTSDPQIASPVINAGNSSYLSEATLNLDLNGDGDKTDTLTTDQRGTGYPRVSGMAVDMGAVEFPIVDSPANAAPSINYTTLHVMTLTWGRLSGATGYEVQISLNSTFTNLQCGGTLDAGQNLYVSTCTLPPGTYYWRVRGKSSSTPGAWSAAIPLVIGIP